MKKTVRRIKKKIVAPKTDYFLDNKIEPTYADVATLQKFITERGKIVPRSRSGLASKTQRQLSIAIKHARHLGLLPFIVRD